MNISASPYHIGKRDSRERMLATRASDNLAIVAYNNLVGGQDELVFDGDSVVFDEKGRLVCRGRQFEEDLVVDGPGYRIRLPHAASRPEVAERQPAGERE